MSVGRILTGMLALLLSACAGIPPDRGMNDVGEMLQARGGAAFSEIKPREQQATSPVDALLDQQLTVETAVRIALLNNPQLKIAYARLGVAAADVYDAARLSNPRLSLADLDSSASGAGNRITVSLAQNFADLILLKSRKRLAATQAERIKYAVAAELFALAQDVSSAYFNYLATEQTSDLRKLSAHAVGLSAALARRYFDSGNINRLELSFAEAEVGEADLAAAMAAADAITARISLNRLLGLTGVGTWQTRPGLPLPIAQEDELSTLQQLAHEQRLDLKAAATNVALHEGALQMTQQFRYLGDLEAGVEYEHETDHSRLLGPTFAFELPIFNQGQGRLLRARATLEQQQATLASLELAIGNAVALAYNQVTAARNRVEIYQSRFIPSRQDVVSRTQELQNYMIVSPFESLRAKNAEYEAYAGYIEALRDYWLARVELGREIGATLPSATQIGERLDINALTRAPAPHHVRERSTSPEKPHVTGGRP